MTAFRPGKTRRARRAIALFGGTFDPLHAGHLAVAEAAVRRFHLDAIYFIPSFRPPHKAKHELTPFAHRYAMVALACACHPRFVPSLAEAPADDSQRVYYSIETVRKFRREFPDDHIYFVVGADQFLEIPTWRSYEDLLDSCDFIIASRPGFRVDALRRVMPPEMLSRAPSRRPEAIFLRESAVYLLTTVKSHVSSTEIRRRRRHGQPIHALVPPRVEDYIQKQALYL